MDMFVDLKPCLGGHYCNTLTLYRVDKNHRKRTAANHAKIWVWENDFLVKFRSQQEHTLVFSFLLQLWICMPHLTLSLMRFLLPMWSLVWWICENCYWLGKALQGSCHWEGQERFSERYSIALEYCSALAEMPKFLKLSWCTHSSQLQLAKKFASSHHCIHMGRKTSVAFRVVATRTSARGQRAALTWVLWGIYHIHTTTLSITGTRHEGLKSFERIVV